MPSTATVLATVSRARLQTFVATNDPGVPTCGGPDQDLDGDGLTAGLEPVEGGDCIADLDADGLLDGEETLSDPLVADSDGDGLLDGVEVARFGGLLDEDEDGLVNVLDDDDDGDGVLTSVERALFTQEACGEQPWRVADIDGDGATDGEEGAVDIDEDGIVAACDADESTGCAVAPELSRELARQAQALAVLGEAAYPTDADDADDDGFIDEEELGLYCVDGSDPDPEACGGFLYGDCADGTPARATDTDGDGLPDWLDADDDGDGVLTEDERSGADVDGDGLAAHLDADSDGDGVSDGVEAVRGSNPDVQDAGPGAPEAVGVGSGCQQAPGGPVGGLWLACGLVALFRRRTPC